MIFQGKRSETVDVAQASPKKIGKGVKTAFKFLPWLASLFGIGTSGVIINDGPDVQSTTQVTPNE
jgi:hypothetical protein